MRTISFTSLTKAGTEPPLHIRKRSPKQSPEAITGSGLLRFPHLHRDPRV